MQDLLHEPLTPRRPAIATCNRRRYAGFIDENQPFRIKSHERRDIQGLYRAIPCSDLEERRHCAHGLSRWPQKRGLAGLEEPGEAKGGMVLSVATLTSQRRPINPVRRARPPAPCTPRSPGGLHFRQRADRIGRVRSDKRTGLPKRPAGALEPVGRHLQLGDFDYFRNNQTWSTYQAGPSSDGAQEAHLMHQKGGPLGTAAGRLRALFWHVGEQNLVAEIGHCRGLYGDIQADWRHTGAHCRADNFDRDHWGSRGPIRTGLLACTRTGGPRFRTRRCQPWHCDCPRFHGRRDCRQLCRARHGASDRTVETDAWAKTAMDKPTRMLASEPASNAAAIAAHLPRNRPMLRWSGCLFSINVAVFFAVF